MTAMPALEDPDPDPDRLQLDNPNRYSETRAVVIRPWLKSLVEDLMPDPSATLAVRFAGDRELRHLNHEFRDQDRVTDVLTFPGEETVDGRHLGDIAVSVPCARRQALERGHSVERELRILLLHGLLHCLGYDHETDQGEMEQLERRLRRRWIPRDA